MGFQRQNGTAAGILFAGVLSTALLGGTTLRALADDDAPGQKTTVARSNTTLDVELSGTSLPAAIAMIQKQLKSVSFVFQSDSENRAKYGTVTLSVHARPINEVLNLVATSAGADIWLEDGIYHIGPKGSHVVAQPVLDTQFIQPITAPVPTKLGQIRLNFADAILVKEQLTGVFAKVNVNLQPGLMNNSIFGDLTRQMPPGPLSAPGSTMHLIQGYYGDTVRPAVPTGTAPAPVGTSGAPSDGSANRSDGPDFNRGGQGFGGGGFGGGQPGGGGGGGNFGGGGGGGGNGAGGLGGGQNQNATGQARGLLPAGIEPNDLTALSNNNVIIVRYRDDAEGEAAFRELQTRIRLLDIKPKQIQIRAQFVTVTQNDADQFGINWQFQKVNLLGVLNAGYAPTGQAIIQFATGNLQTQLNFALTTGRGKVVASPMATTFNNVPAQFSNTTQFYSFIPETFIGPGGAAQTTYYPEAIPATSALFVTPRINGDNTITLNGQLQFEDESGTATAPDGTDYPILIQQLTPVTRIIRNGDTMVLAGLIRKQDNSTVDKVPLLGDLPLIGSLFRSRSINTDDSELLVFITATILADPIAGGSLAVGGGLTAPVGGPGAGQ
jgi:uncharacterized membrane protein YgcG